MAPVLPKKSGSIYWERMKITPCAPGNLDRGPYTVPHFKCLLNALRMFNFCHCAVRRNDRSGIEMYLGTATQTPDSFKFASNFIFISRFLCVSRAMCLFFPAINRYRIEEPS